MIEAGPTASTVEFGSAFEELSAAGGTDECAFRGVEIPVLAGKGSLGSLLTQHVELLRGQVPLPLGLGLLRYVGLSHRVYSATISPAKAKRTALQQYLQTFFGGSLTQMMTALVRDGSWSDGDLETLKSENERVRKERKES